MGSKTKTRCACLITAAQLVILLGASAVATDYAVSPKGSDSAAGTAEAPFRTIGKGLGVLAPGDTLAVAPGVYRESCTLSVTASKESPVVIRGVEMPHIEASGRDGILITDSAWVRIEGLKITGAERAGVLIGGSENVTLRGCILGDNGVWGVQSAMSRHITVEKCEIYGSKKEHGIYFSTTDYPTATDNRIRDCASCGVHMNGDLSEGGDGMITGATIARNQITGCGSAGGSAINMDGVEKSLIDANVIDRNLAGGITSFKGDGKSGGSGNTIRGNLIRFAPGVGRFGVQLLGGSTKTTLEQNVIDITNGPAVEVDEMSAKGFRATRNFYVPPEDELKFSWKGEELGFEAWQAATGQDMDSHVRRSVPRPSPPPADSQ